MRMLREGRMGAEVWLCARHERLLAARSRWTHIFAVAFKNRVRIDLYVHVKITAAAAPHAAITLAA